MEHWLWFLGVYTARGPLSDFVHMLSLDTTEYSGS